MAVQPSLCWTWLETQRQVFSRRSSFMPGQRVLSEHFQDLNGLWFLAHLRLIGELIVHLCSGVLRPSVCPQFQTTPKSLNWPIKAKFCVEPPWVGGTKVCLQHLGHMTKMATMPIYGKNPSKIFSGTDFQESLVCSIGDPSPS